MSEKIWPHATPQHPCPVCGKNDWCTFGNKKMRCMRVPSDHVCDTGGWYHDYGAGAVVRIPIHRLHSVPEYNAASWMARLNDFKRSTVRFQVEALAKHLHVSSQALAHLDASWAHSAQAWAFPMRNADNEIVGMRLRSLAGKKWAITGSRQGLFIPQFIEAQGAAFFVEGPTNCAAGLSLGLFTIGRPSCNAGNEVVCRFVRLRKIRQVVIVADNDNAMIAGKLVSPGIEGAKRLRSELNCKTVIWIPPTKDLRDFVKCGGTKDMVLSEIKNLLWARR